MFILLNKLSRLKRFGINCNICKFIINIIVIGWYDIFMSSSSFVVELY